MGEYMCLWVSMTTLKSEEITLSSDSVYQCGISAFDCQWQHLTVKRSLCPLIVLNGGYICLWVSMTTLNSEEITLSSASVDWVGISAFECQWQHWTVKRSLCPLIVLNGGYIYLWVSMTTLNSDQEITLSSDSVEWKVYLPLSVNCYVDQGSISAFECQWQHWTVKRSLCPLIVFTSVVYLPLIVNDNI